MPEAADRDPFRLIGAVIDGKYRVAELVGEGGFGVVYRGVHEVISTIMLNWVAISLRLSRIDSAMVSSDTTET